MSQEPNLELLHYLVESKDQFLALNNGSWSEQQEDEFMQIHDNVMKESQASAQKMHQEAGARHVFALHDARPQGVRIDDGKAVLELDTTRYDEQGRELGAARICLAFSEACQDTVQRVGACKSLYDLVLHRNDIGVLAIDRNDEMLWFYIQDGGVPEMCEMPAHTPSPRTGFAR